MREEVETILEEIMYEKPVEGISMFGGDYVKIIGERKELKY